MAGIFGRYDIRGTKNELILDVVWRKLRLMLRVVGRFAIIVVAATVAVIAVATIAIYFYLMT